MVHALLIEDEQRIAELIKKSLEEQGLSVTIAYDGAMGKKLAIGNDYDIIITDIVLLKINGIDLCKEIRLQKPAIPIIMLTALGTTDDKVEGFDAGADDYLVKLFDLRELHARIRVLLKRSQHNANAHGFVLKYADLHLNLDTKMVKRNNKEISLTPKELKLLEYMMQNPERVLSRTEIAEKVWETTFEAYDWNCPQHITPRYTVEDIEEAFAGQRNHIAKLEAEIKELKQKKVAWQKV